MGTAREKTLYVGQSLNDDIYHSVVIRRRGRNVRATVDDDEPLVGELRCIMCKSVHATFSSTI